MHSNNFPDEINEMVYIMFKIENQVVYLSKVKINESVTIHEFTRRENQVI